MKYVVLFLSERDKKYNYSYKDAGQEGSKTDKKQADKKKKGDGLKLSFTPSACSLQQ